MSRVVIAAILISLHWMWGAPVALAAEWCDTDPLVAITTPGGNVVPVYVMVGVLGAEHLPAAQVASILYTTASDKATAGGAATKVELTVLVPDDAFATGFPTRSTASSEPYGTGIVYDSTYGKSGQQMVLKFTLPVP